MNAPLCFVLMPFRTKSEAGVTVEFDEVYRRILEPAVTAAGLTCLRADEDQVAAVIHKSMFERILLCPFAVADLTMANANVFYELGIRHAVRPWSTILVCARGFRLPFRSDARAGAALPHSTSAAARSTTTPSGPS